MLPTFRPGRRRSLPNRNLQMGNENLPLEAPLDLGSIRRFEEQLQRFCQIAPGFFDNVALRVWAISR